MRRSEAARRRAMGRSDLLCKQLLKRLDAGRLLDRSAGMVKPKLTALPTDSPLQRLRRPQGGAL